MANFLRVQTLLQQIQFLTRLSPHQLCDEWWPANRPALDTSKYLLVLTDMARIRPTVMLVLFGVLMCAGHSLPSSIDNAGLFNNMFFVYLLIMWLKIVEFEIFTF